MFYLGEIAALLICWLFYIEFYWMVERKVLKVCSRQYLRKRCSKPADRLFFTPVSGKAHLGTLYYLNRLLVYYLSIFTLVHLLFGWAEILQGVIRTFTTITVLSLGLVAVLNSSKSAEYICANVNVTSKRIVLLFRILSSVSVVIITLVYLYFAWIYI
jgi:hypothetical protein